MVTNANDNAISPTSVGKHQVGAAEKTPEDLIPELSRKSQVTTTDNGDNLTTAPAKTIGGKIVTREEAEKMIHTMIADSFAKKYAQEDNKRMIADSIAKYHASQGLLPGQTLKQLLDENYVRTSQIRPECLLDTDPSSS